MPAAPPSLDLAWPISVFTGDSSPARSVSRIGTSCVATMASRVSRRDVQDRSHREIEHRADVGMRAPGSADGPPRGPWHQEVLAGVRVVDVLVDLAEDLSRQIGVDRSEHRRGDEGRGLSPCWTTLVGPTRSYFWREPLIVVSSPAQSVTASTLERS